MCEKKESSERKKKEPSEKLYDSLTKAFQSTYRVIKYAIYPATAILALIICFGIYWGIDIKKSKSSILSTKQEIENIHELVSLKSREIEISAREIEYNAKDRFNKLTDNITQLESEFEQIRSRFQRLISQYEKALVKNETLFKKLDADNKTLSEFSNVIQENITKYTDEIAYARKGIEQRKKDIESVLKKRNEELEAVQKSTVLLLEYLVLMQSKSNEFPNPNIKKGIDILNKILVILIPDKKERDAVITRINKSIKDK